MKISDKKKEALFAALCEQITDLRIELKLQAQQDFVLAQSIHKIWAAQKKVLGL